MKITQLFLITLFMSFVVFGLIESGYPAGSDEVQGLSFLHKVIMALLIFFWVKNDAKENNLSLAGVNIALATLLPPIGVPAYYFKYFGFKRGGLKVLKSIALFFALVTGYLIPYHLFH